MKRSVLLDSRRGPDDLLEQLGTHTRQVINNPESRPIVLALESRYGKGKTYALQRLYDSLSDDDPEGYWRAGLGPGSVPRSERELKTSRKRIADPALCNPIADPTWLWIGVSCGTASSDRSFDDPLLSAFRWQLEYHIRSHELRRGLLNALGRRAPRLRDDLAGSVTEQVLDVTATLPVGALSVALFKIGKVVLEAFKDSSRSAEDVDAVQMELLFKELLRFIDTASDAGITTVIALDDAHRCTPLALRFLALALTDQPPAWPRRYFQPVADGAARRRLVLLTTSWPTEETDGELPSFFRELRSTLVDVKTFAEEEGWFPNITTDAAIELFARNVPALSRPAAGQIVGAGAQDGKINPLLLMFYVAAAVDSEIDESVALESWLRTLPVSLEDIQERRVALLSSAAVTAVRLASSVGTVVPTRMLQLAYQRRVGEEPPWTVTLQELGTRRFLVATGHASEDLAHAVSVDSVTFADEADYGWLHSHASRYPWVRDIVGISMRDWYDELLRYLAGDLEDGLRPVPFPWIVGVVEPTLETYFSGEGRTQVCDWFAYGVSRHAGATALAPTPTLSTASDSFAWLFAVTSKLADRDDATVAHAWRVAASQYPRSRTAVVLAGHLLARRGESSEHVEEATDLLYDNRAYLPAAYQLAKYYRTAAPDKLREIVGSLAVSNSAAVMLANLLRAADPVTARLLYERAVDDPRAAIALARMVRSSDPSRAMALLEKAAPGDAGAAIELSRLIRRAEPERARAVLEKFEEDPRAVLELARLLGDSDLETSQRILQRVSTNPHVAMVLSQVLRIRNPDASIAVLEAVSDSPLPAIELSRLIRRSDPRRARQLLERVAGNPAAAIELAKMLRSKDKDAALAVLKRAPFTARVALELARMTWDTEPAAARQLLSSFTASPAMVIELARLVGRRDRNEAVAILEQAPPNPLIAVELAKTLFRVDPVRARAAVEPFAATNAAAAIELASLVREDDASMAQSVLEPFVNHAVEAAIAYARLCPPHASDRARAILEQFSDHYSAAIELARLIRRTDPGAALQVLERLAHDPNVAIELSRHVRSAQPDLAYRILDAVSYDANAAIELSRLIRVADPDRSRAILEPVSSDANVAIELAKLIRESDVSGALELLEALPLEEHVAIERAMLVSRHGNFDAAYSLLIDFALNNPNVALLLMRNAVGEERLEVARGLLARHMSSKEGRDHVFRKLTEVLGSTEAICRVFPRSGAWLNQYFSFLSARSRTELRAAALFGCLARDVFTDTMNSAKQQLLANAKRSALCAVELSRFPLTARECAAVLSILERHADAGDRKATFGLARLSHSSGDAQRLLHAISMIERFRELIDWEKETYLDVAANPRLSFTKLREDHWPWATVSVWAAQPL